MSLLQNVINLSEDGSISIETPHGETTVFHQGQRRGIDEPTKKFLRKRSRIEPVIWRLEPDHRLGRNFLLGEEGDKINLLLSAAAFNLRKLLSVFCSFNWLDQI